MFLKLVKGLQGVQSRCVGGFTKQIHTQMCLAALFDQRRKVENEWDDDEHEQKRAFHEEETRVQRQQPKCEITGKSKRPGSVDCTCNDVCITKKSETHLIHYEGGVDIIPKK
jgi:hypothetical protein